MVKGLAKLGTASAMAYRPSVLTRASSISVEERLLPNDGRVLAEAARCSNSRRFPFLSGCD